MGTKRKQREVNMGDQSNNLVFPSQQHSASARVVRSTRDEKPLHYTLKIQSFSLLKATLAKSQCDRYESQSFNVGGYNWRLALYPNGDVKRNGSAHISLYLVSAENKILSTNSEVNVVFTFLVYDILKDKYLIVQDGKIRRFHAMKIEWGFEKLVSLNTFNDASNGLLVDDCCAFWVDIFVKKSDDGKGEVLSLINQPKNNKYTWKINNFSTLDTTLKESNPFTVGSYTWKIRLCCPRGCNGTTAESFSLYLFFDGSKEHPQSSKVYAEFEIAVLSQLEVGTRRRTYNFWFGKGIGLGHSNFMPLSDLKEPTKGFLHNDTLIVEVKINATSNLKNL